MAATSKERIVAVGTGVLYSAAKTATPVGATWTPWVSTLKGSFSITQEDGETTEIFIDQSDLPIKQTYKAGKMNVKFTVPDMSKKNIMDFFETVTVSEAAPSGYEAIGVKVGSKKISKMLKVDLAEKDLTIIFPNLDIFRKFSGDNVNETPMGVEVTCTVLADPDAAKPDIIFLAKMDGI